MSMFRQYPGVRLPIQSSDERDYQVQRTDYRCLEIWQVPAVPERTAGRDAPGNPCGTIISGPYCQVPSGPFCALPVIPAGNHSLGHLQEVH